ncbi:MAG: dihydropteroate synthase [Rhodospirillales bacterium]
MGVVNVTPDSFSDGGETAETAAAIDRGLALADEGADIIDVGGESTRPGAVPVAIEDELARVVPVVRDLAARGLLVSVDTRRAEVMAAAITAGARIVNDVTALAGDARALGVVADAGVGVVLMHMQGDPRTMQLAPVYRDPAGEIHSWLARRIAVCRDAGISGDRIAVDPGIGFGKTVEHNVDILARLRLFRDLGTAVLVGVSRKSFIAALSAGEPPRKRRAGSIAAILAAVQRGADIVRVHDVADTRQALAVWRAIGRAGEDP